MKSYAEKVTDRRKALTEEIRREFIDEANRCVHILKSAGFKFKRIYLFGSAIKEKPLSSSSDIDLAIEGLDETRYYRAYACLLKNSKFRVDLKPFESLDKSLKEKILKEGRIIYEE